MLLVDERVRIKVADGEHVWREYYGGSFKLYTRVLVEETKQIFQEENFIGIDEDVTMKLVWRTRERR